MADIPLNCGGHSACYIFNFLLSFEREDVLSVLEHLHFLLTRDFFSQHVYRVFFQCLSDIMSDVFP